MMVLIFLVCGLVSMCALPVLGSEACASDGDKVSFLSLVDSDAYTYRSIVDHPEVGAADVDKRIIAEGDVPSEYLVVRIANIGPDQYASDQTKVMWPVGDKTGFYPAEGLAARRYQRGPSNIPGSTAVQIRGKEMGIYINSQKPGLVYGTLIPICPGYWWLDASRAVHPFKKPGSVISFSFDMKVPTADRSGDGEVYMCAYLLLQDAKSNRSVWYGVSLFDLRPAWGDFIHFDDWEGGTNLPIIVGFMDGTSEFFHGGPNSDVFQQAAYDDYKHFDMRVSEPEFIHALKRLKARFPELALMSDDPADYRIAHINLNPETHSPEGSHAEIGLAVRNIRLELYEVKE